MYRTASRSGTAARLPPPLTRLGSLLLLVVALTACSGDPAPRVQFPDPPAEEQAAATSANPQPIATANAQPVAAAPALVAAPAPVPGAAPARASRLELPLHPFLPAEGRARVVVLDPGHGGAEIGAAGAGVAEKDVNLRIAFKLKDLLESEGMQVVLVRDSDRRAIPPPGFEPPPDWRDARKDLQARLDIANLAGGDIYISIHNNGHPDGVQRGTEVWWDGRRPFAAYNQALAEQVLTGMVDSIRAAGYPTVNRGLNEDTYFRVFQGRTFPIFVLGPPRTGVATTRAGNMPAALGESLFLSYPPEAVQLTREPMLDAIARGYRDGIVRYFRMIDSGALTLPIGGLPPEVPNYYDTQGPPPGTR